jgi:DNA-binding transcriptional LysR family regulator
MIDRRIHVLRMLAASGTVTAAAEVLHYTPSAVSQQIRTLGKDLGVELLVHDGRGVRLTPAARTLLARVDDLISTWEEIRAEVSAAGDGSDTGQGELRLCGFSTAAAALLPAVAARMTAERPNCRVTMIEADPGECFELLLADEADVAVVVATPQVPAETDRRFEQEHLLQDPLDLLVPAAHPVTAAGTVALRDLAGERWIMDRPGQPYHDLLLTACAGAGFTPAAAHFAREWDTGAAMVAAGFGVALIPRLARLPSGYDVQRIPLSGDPQPVRHILTAYRRGRRSNPSVAAALAALRDVAALHG